MKTTPLSFACPKCGSEDVFYSCEPTCCFNHVCSVCHTTFEPVTHATGKKAAAQSPAGERDTTGPTCQCEVCESINVYSLEDGTVVCVDCGSVLEIEFSEVVEGG